MTESLQDCAARIVRDEIRADVSTLVATLAGGAGPMDLLFNQELPDLRRLTELADQALELAAPVDDWEEAARQAGWRYDDGGPHWFKPSDTPFHCAGQYARYAQEACESEGLDPYPQEVYEHWAVSQRFGEKLAAKGERVDFDFAGLVVWARTNTGQSIEIDSVIEAIAADIVAADKE